jgi:hypothetical protein
MTLEPLLQMPPAWTGFSGGLGVHLFRGKLTVGDMDRLDAFGVQWRRRNTAPTVEMSIVFPSDARMTGEERARMAQLIKRWEHQRLASATVILATGMQGALQRSVLTGLLLLAPPPHPTKVCSTVREAVTWLGPHLRALAGFDATPEETVAGVEAFCAAFLARRGPASA